MTRKDKAMRKNLLAFGQLLKVLGEVAASEVFIGLSHTFEGWQMVFGEGVAALAPDILQAACEACPGLWFEHCPPRFGAPQIMFHG